jgi:PAS domain S-box-containing protein
MLLTIWSVQQQEYRLRADLITKTHIIQGGISTGQITAMTGTEADLHSPGYRVLKAQMMHVHSADPLIRFIYLMGQQPDGTVFFLIDSEPEDSGDCSPPGQVYTEASSDVLKVFSSGEETTAGPVTDRWGTWMSGLVPIRDARSGKVIAVLGTDIDARDWNTQILIASIPAVIAMLLLLLLLLIFFYVQQRNERERRILTTSEAAIRESEGRLTDIINFLPDATLVIDTGGKVISWNKAMEEMTGIAAKDMLGKGDHEYSIPFYGERRPILIDLIFESEDTIARQYHGIIHQKGTLLIGETDLPQLKGKRAVLWGKASPLYDGTGKVIGAIETIRDITQRKLVENALQEREEQFRMVFEKGPLGMVIVNEQFRFVKVNPMFCSMVGYSPEELLTKKFTEITHPDYITEEIVQLQKLADREISEYAVEKQYVKKNGDAFFASIVVSVVRSKEGRFLYYLALITDITERKAVEREIEYHATVVNQYAEDLRQTNDKLNLLNTITRHDILNQLTVVLGYLEMMKAKFPDPALQDYIDKEIHAAQNIQTQILFTKEYQDIGVQSPQWFDLGKVILANAASLPLSNVEVIVDVDNLELYADPLLSKVFYTLFENALRHGKTVTRIEFSYRTQDENLVVIFRDNGVGIPAEYKKAILQRKYFKHTGFGLYLSQTILGITGMSLEENGEPGKGAQFEIQVPEGSFRFAHVEK